MSILLDREITQDFERATGVEWLEPNGLGGWAGTTVAGAHSRRYHGLLVAATRPEQRTVLLSRLDETIHAGGESFDLGCNQFPGAVAPRGFEYLASFQKGLFPVFEYEAGGVRLRKTVTAVDGENTTLVLYEVLEASGPFILSLRPFLAARDQHALTSAQHALPQTTAFSEGILRLAQQDEIEVFVAVPGADFQANPQWWYRFEYEGDRRRGFDFQEDLWTPGLFGRELAAGDRLGIVISTADPRGRDAFALFEKERKRREKILRSLPKSLEGDELARQLALAGDGFLVRRGTQQRSVVAGYPGLGERSRDAMISLPGLCLVTGRFDDARKVLRSAARALDGGLFPEEAEGLAAVDAPLWFCVAGWKHLQATGDEDFARETLLPAVRKIVQAFQKGTRHGIRMDEDGLLLASDPEVALTWMDGRETLRAGKPVEVEALWANALAILTELEKRCGDADEAKRRAREAKRAQKSFEETFWNEADGTLFDVIDGESRAGAQRPSQMIALRPNQVIALSLPFPLLPKTKAARVLEAVERELYTPVGLRSLAPGHPDYRPSYEGSPIERERAYHQGTVWSWLLGPYLTALVRVHGAAGRKKGLAAIEALRPRLAEAGVGSLSEVFDGDAPHAPRGCIARAWSVAEVLRAWVEDLQVAPVKERETKEKTEKVEKEKAKKPLARDPHPPSPSPTLPPAARERGRRRPKASD